MRFKAISQPKTVACIASVGKVALWGCKWLAGRYNDSLGGASKIGDTSENFKKKFGRGRTSFQKQPIRGGGIGHDHPLLAAHPAFRYKMQVCYVGRNVYLCAMFLVKARRKYLMFGSLVRDGLESFFSAYSEKSYKSRTNLNFTQKEKPLKYSLSVS